MKKVGIVGGIGPASTLDYYRGIIKGGQEKAAAYPGMVINSISMTDMLALVAAEKWDELVSMMLKAIQELANAGAEFAAIASNTPHIVFSEVEKKSPLPLISIVEETCAYAQGKGCKSVVVVGTRFTMSSGLYTEALEKCGIAAFIPTAEEQEIIHNIIFPNLENGIVLPEEKKIMLDLMNELITRFKADALLLGCTELPLIIQEGEVNALLLDTAQIHIKAIVKAL